MKRPELQIVQGYQEIFDEEPPSDRLSFIREFSYEHVLVEIVGLNYRLKPAKATFIDRTWNTQVKELKRFTYRREILDNVLLKCSSYFGKKGKYPNFFSRQSCVFAIEEIVNCKEMKSIPGFEMNKEEVWLNIFKYLLCINSEISKTNDKIDDNNSFEGLNPKLLPLNELSIESDPLYTPLRGLKLFEFLDNDDVYSPLLREYLSIFYGVTTHQFFLNIMGYALSNKQEFEELNFYYRFDSVPRFILKMSERKPNRETHKLLNIRKSPFIKFGINGFVLADNMFLLEKSYNQFVNDFWFDYLKTKKTNNGKALLTIEKYRGDFGYFFEFYVNSVLRKIFEHYRYSFLKTFDELRIKTTDGEIELADFYFRYNQKIIVGQVKAGSIYDKEKYGADLESLYKNDRAKFFEKFGVDQVANSIRTIEENSHKLDPKYPQDKNRIIYPVIVFNDKLFQTALMPDVFNKRFQELILNFNFKKITIKPLSIIHISDLEQLQYAINNNPKRIWEILKVHCSDPTFMPPFYDSLQRLQIRGKYTDELVEEIAKALGVGF